MASKLRIDLSKFLWGSVALLVLLASGWFAHLVYRTQPNQLVKTLLRLESVPASIRDAECESWGLTDVLTTCYFEIEPAEFPALLRGWAFQQEPADGGSHSFTGPKVGPDFPVATEFFVQNPPEFPDGGHVILMVDSGRARVQVDYYQE